MEKVRMTIRVVPKLDEKISKTAKETGKSKNAVIIDACWDFIKKRRFQ
ncbi:toxin-antitoxin system HicB family antitoxin [Peptostreptococcus equinus]|uniref:Toxin-antitoxin system HicB family antitoxin n=1 Tax=Peptostreptococcus equinus TaxID=3003601 RepID=A0ABY7JU55_9FIRM|nr:toxin-antitoxin system HicB family antitoxin [Peptostreptococcus sp. CBA3647]WAW15247.1 toxin-antitoxin system HicB family antitoxin [Peptostreptococcus sp. CBA3647]